MHRVIRALGLLFWSAIALADEAAAPDSQPPFDVVEYRVEGATLLPRAAVENAVYPYLGGHKTLTDVESARRSLEQAYRDAGYAAALVSIPEQDVSGGVVRLQVTESRLDRVLITGARYFSPEELRAQLPALAPGVPLHLPALQEQLTAAAAAAPDRTLTPVFRPGREPGAMEAEVKVEDRLPLHGSVGLDDRYTEGSSRLRLNAMLHYDNLWQRQHSLALGWQASPEDWNDVRVWTAAYAWPDEAARWQVSAIHSVSRAAALGTLGVLGDGDIYGLTWSRPVGAVDHHAQSVRLGLDYKDQRQSVLLASGAGISTPISYNVEHAEYDDFYQGGRGTTHLNTGVHFGMRGLGNDPDEFRNKRYNATPDFIFVRADLERLQAGWRGTTWRAHLSAQVTGAPLISNEDFSAGGADTVRGYFESQALGDDAVLANLELRSPRLVPARWTWLQDMQLLAFADDAWLRHHDALPAEQAHLHLESVGAGARLAAGRGFSAALDWARPTVSFGNVHAGDARVHFNVQYEF